MKKKIQFDFKLKDPEFFANSLVITALFKKSADFNKIGSVWRAAGTGLGQPIQSTDPLIHRAGHIAL